MKIGQNIFFLTLYMHWLACIFNLMVLYNGPDSYFIQRDGTYIGIDSQILKDEFGNNYLYDGRDQLYLTKHYFKDEFWHRLTEDDGIIGWQGYNDRWDGRLTQWYSPIDWYYYREQIFHTEEMTNSMRFFTMLYYSLINLGLGDVSPVN